jgi:hypothetical protein
MHDLRDGISLANLLDIERAGAALKITIQIPK